MFLGVSDGKFLILVQREETSTWMSSQSYFVGTKFSLNNNNKKNSGCLLGSHWAPEYEWILTGHQCDHTFFTFFTGHQCTHTRILTQFRCPGTRSQPCTWEVYGIWVLGIPRVRPQSFAPFWTRTRMFPEKSFIVRK